MRENAEFCIFAPENHYVMELFGYHIHVLIIIATIIAIASPLWIRYIIRLIKNISASIRESYEKKVDRIKKDYPLAYQKYITDHNITSSDPPTSSLRELSSRNTELWNKEEINLRYYRIKKAYPDGLKKWQHNNLSLRWDTTEIVSNEEKIKYYDKVVKESREYDEWEKEQSEFTKKCREIGPGLMTSFGYYKYNIPFDRHNDNDNPIKGKYLVWQFFADSYCLENDLDYDNFEYIKTTTETIPAYKGKRWRYSPMVFEQISSFIIQLGSLYDVVVYLCTNNKEWTTDNLFEYYFNQFSFDTLPDNIDVCDPISDNILFDEVIDYDKYPILKKRCIIIVEMQTDNDHLKEVCSKIIEKNKDNHPLITYISLLKGYDKDEMLELIEKKNKEIAEEERKKEEERQLMLKKQEIEISIKGLPSLIESNNVDQIESKIKYINDNIDIISTEDKNEFEQIKIDYNAKKEIGIPQKEELLYVNYNYPNDDDDGYYAIVRTPERGCVVWPYRRRTIARRGFTESDFEIALYKYLTPKVSVLGDVNILPQDGVRPYEPDIALVYSENGLNVRIDIEIDEPYAAITNKPTHYIGCGDEYRDANLNSLGWIVVRFSERQVFQQTDQCVKFVADIINCIDNTFIIPELAKIPELNLDKQWSKIESQKMAENRVRQKYLNHNFGLTEEAVYNTKDLKLTSFETSILKKVKPRLISRPLNKPSIPEDDYENDNNILFNKANAFEQDRHIEFDATQHIYTIDGIQYRSVSTVISDLFPEFDTEKWSTIKARERGVAPQQVAEEWDSKGRQSREVGTFMHQQIENYLLNKSIDYEYHYTYDGNYVHEDTVVDISLELSLFKEFRDRVPINPFRTEWRIFDKSLKLAGTIDLISKNEDGSYNIYDWKRSSRLYNDNRFQHGLGKLAHLEDTPRNHYYLQQNLYRYILEHQYGLKIKEMKLVGLYNLYDLIDVPKMDEEVSIIIQMM
jgi:hypothetical protein